MTGPYETEVDALDGPLYREVHELHEPGRYRNEAIGHVVAATQFRHLKLACAEAGVELGAFDRKILEWLSGYEASTVQVIIGLISRAGAAS
ncbi:MAG TPA: hypothetical protein VGN22_03620 [Pseudonocardia sp.]